MSQNEPKTKKLKSSILSDPITTTAFQTLFRTHWQASTPLKTPTLELIPSPFRVCKISNFLSSEEFLEDLKNELSDIETRRPETDLYSFEQTSDLANVDTERIKQLHHLFKTEISSWMSTNTGIKLNTTLSMSSARYSDTDYLLCHDDNLGDRRIAFVLYLSTNWTAEDGGSLDLFDTDPCGLPRNIVHSLVPEYNSLVFFEVSDTSYHQVAEVTTPDKTRWTINGWFHGPINPSTRPPRLERELTFYEPSETTEELSSWVIKSYLCEDIKKGIQKAVEKDSYTFLTDFLKKEVFHNVLEDIMSEGIKWTKVGPADLRNYEVADENSLPRTLKRFYEMFRSIGFFKILKEYTELDLVPDGEGMKPKMVIELQRWTKGCYTLICDGEGGEEGLIDGEGIDNGFHVEEVEKDKKDSSRNVGRGRKGSSSSSEGSPDDSEEEKERILMTKRRRTREGVSRDSEDNRDDMSDYLGDGGESVSEPGTLDVIMQFNTSRVPEDATIDYVDPNEHDGALIHVPAEDNHLCLVYKTRGTCRVQKYVNHYCEGFFYNLVCSYYE